MTTADYILKGNAIFDAASSAPFAGFIAVKENRILAVEKNSDAYERLVDNHTKVIDCGDGLIMPGMIDAHMHFFDGIFQNSKFMCRDLFPCKSAAECVETIAAFAQAHPDYKTITGIGWYIPLWEDPAPPTKQMLDAIEPDRPVYLMCADGHSFWLNSKAMEECQIDPGKKLLYGEIVTDENGQTTGLMHELDACAVCAVNAQKLPEEQREEMILDFTDALMRVGITSTTDVTILPEPIAIPEDVKTVAALEDEGRFPIRLNLYPSMGTTEDFSIAEEYRKTFTSDKLRIAGLKGFIDGVHGSHTALLTEPYLDEPDKIGESFYSHAHYMKQVEAANRAGFAVKLHCCGEGAVIWALDAYENSKKKNGFSNLRNSIEHIETLNPKNNQRFIDNDVTATIQPLHLTCEGYILHSLLGPERAQYEFALKSMIESGINVAFSSDYPVAEFDPMVNIYVSVTRCDKDGIQIEENPTQQITIAQALTAHTAGGAYCVGMDDRLGTLQSGKLADIIVLDQNLFDIPHSDILKTQVKLTMIDGVITHNQLY